MWPHATSATMTTTGHAGGHSRHGRLPFHRPSCWSSDWTECPQHGFCILFVVCWPSKMSQTIRAIWLLCVNTTQALKKIKNTHNPSLRQIASLPKMHHLSFASGLSRLNTHHLKQKRSHCGPSAYSMMIWGLCTDCRRSITQHVLRWLWFIPENVFSGSYFWHFHHFRCFYHFHSSHHLLFFATVSYCAALCCVFWERGRLLSTCEIALTWVTERFPIHNMSVCVCVTIRKTYEGCNTAAV